MTTRMKEVCGATSRMMKDELIVGEHQVDGTRLLYLSFIVTMYWTKFLYELYSNSCLGFFFFLLCQ